jgi:hypothetical protein
MTNCKECKKLAETNSDLLNVIESLRDELSLKDRIIIAINEFVDVNKYKTHLNVNDIFKKLNDIFNNYDF